MSDFHYVRTLGSDGGVDVCSGPAIGLDLASVLADGLPPFNVVLQILAGVCEILDIAEEDERVHGNLELEHVFVDDTGAISIEGFGQSRTRAPEGKPKGSATDLYGLGFVAYRLFSGRDLPALPAEDPGAHDDAVIDAVLTVDLAGLNDEMVGDVQWFLAKLLSFDREDRPSAVECWRTFVAFADEAKGPEFVQWCLDALDGGGERRVASAVEPDTAPGLELEEDLDGPLVSKGPLQKGGLSFDNAPAAAGTAFFSKAEMKAALDDASQIFRPAAGGGAATNYWTRDQLQSMANNGPEAPKPKRAVGEGERRKTMATSRSAVKEMQRAQDQERPDTPPPTPSRPRPQAPSRPPSAPPAPEPRLQSSPPERPTPAPPRPSLQPAPAPTAPAAAFPTDFEPVPAEPQDLGEATIRMKAPSVRTTRTPLPPPQVQRPTRAVGSREPTPSPIVSRPPSQEETVISKLSDIERQAAEASEVDVEDSIASGNYGAAYFDQDGPPQLPVEPPVPAYQAPTPTQANEERSFNLAIIAGILVVVAIAVVSCLGLGGGAAVVAFFGGSSGTTIDRPVVEPPSLPPLPTPEPVPTDVAPEPAPARPGPQPTRPTPRPGPEPQPVRPDPQPVRPAPPPVRPDPQPVRPGPQPVRPSPQPVRPSPVAPAPTPEPGVEDPPVTLTLKSSGRGRLNCPGVANKPFDGNTSLNIETYQLPATCMVDMEGKKAAFQVLSTGQITCNLNGAQVSCDRTTVP